MTDIDTLFFELIQIAIGNKVCLSHSPTAEGWKALYDIAKKQSLVGICFAAVQRLAEDMRPSEMLYLTWMGMAAKIQQRNEVMNASTKKALDLFRKDRFECTTLKGQGIAALYRVGSNGSKGSSGTLQSKRPDGPSANFEQPKALNCLNGSQSIEPEERDLSLLRQSGDIDLWVQGGRKKLYDYSLRTFGRLEGLTYHHIHFPIWDDVEIEAHTWPSFLSSLIKNKRLQKFCKMHATNEDTPSLAFNRVFILLHCYQHFTRRGVGMRQLLDYYFVLLTSYDNANDDDNLSYKQESTQWISALGMKRFAEATMWVMKEIFGLEDKYLLCEPNEEYGRFLLDEVMQTGNMGHADERVDHRQLQSAIGRYLFNLKRDIRIIKICPHEALWEPIWGIFQFAWCRLTQLKYKR